MVAEIKCKCVSINRQNEKLILGGIDVHAADGETPTAYQQKYLPLLAK